MTPKCKKSNNNKCIPKYQKNIPKYFKNMKIKLPKVRKMTTIKSTLKKKRWLIISNSEDANLLDSTI